MWSRRGRKYIITVYKSHGGRFGWCSVMGCYERYFVRINVLIWISYDLFVSKMFLFQCKSFCIGEDCLLEHRNESVKFSFLLIFSFKEVITLEVSFLCSITPIFSVPSIWCSRWENLPSHGCHWSRLSNLIHLPYGNISTRWLKFMD